MFTIFSGRNGLYYWNLKGKNGEIVCSSEGYSTYQAAQTGVNACCRIVWEIINQK